ncbi:MAG: type II toxin-antitoxin system Phd/YefM family antitoxin [Elusimicrobiota bacterium]
MTTITASQARANIFKLVDQARTSHQPVQITTKRGNAVLISEEDYRSVQETLYLLSIPGMRKKILKGKTTSLSNCLPIDKL